MKRAIAVALLAGALLAPASSSAAGVALIGPWITPEAEIHWSTPCPDQSARPAACAMRAERQIYISAPRRAMAAPFILEHERGHVFDWWNLDELERAAIMRRAGWSWWRVERFANEYAACRLSTGERIAIRERGWDVVREPIPALCRLIAASA